MTSDRLRWTLQEGPPAVCEPEPSQTDPPLPVRPIGARREQAAEEFLKEVTEGAE